MFFLIDFADFEAICHQDIPAPWDEVFGVYGIMVGIYSLSFMWDYYTDGTFTFASLGTKAITIISFQLHTLHSMKHLIMKCVYTMVI